jgi:hypothetical protein
MEPTLDQNNKEAKRQHLSREDLPETEEEENQAST